MNDFVHLHVHTQFSLLDGLCKIPKLLKRSQDMGMKSLAITDHGVLYGAIQFFTKAKELGIKPIIGVEAYMASASRLDKQSRFGSDQAHLLLLAKNDQGYRNLLSLVTIAHLEGYHYRPRIDWEVLEKHKAGLIVTSSCLRGQISQYLLHNEPQSAARTAEKFQKLFADDFYLEIQDHPKIPEQNKTRKQLIKMSRDMGIPLVATNDVHYIDPEDAQAQDALLAIQTRKTIADKDRLSMLDSPDFYLKTPEEMYTAFADTPDALENTLKIAAKCNLDIPIGNWILPEFPLPNAQTAESYLRKITSQNISLRFPEPTPEVQKRIDYELDVICNKGFAAYFLIVQDFVNWAKNNGIRVGPGRGSAAGSLVSYILRITSINPLEHGLPFERFLNPERPTPPDIDLDFADNRRDEVIEYVSKKYGEKRVAQIITFGTMEARGSIRDIGRVLGMPYEEPDRIAKLIPLGSSIDEALTSVFELQEYYKQEKYKKLLDLAKKVEGVARHASTHAAGVVLGDRDLEYYTPLQQESKAGKIITQYDMYSLDLNSSKNAIGLLKMDFLGLRNLTILGEAVRLVKESRKLDVDLSDLPLNDKKVYELLASGETTGIFQLESSGMRRVARTLKPSRFSDITAMVALYRPGPMELINDFIQGKKNPARIHYPHQDLKEILGETYGVAVYQEQCMQIAAFLAGFTMAEADNLRLAIGKKKKLVMDKEKKKFIKGAQKKGYTKKVADKVWGFIEKFAGYGFNKPHAASYAMIAYQTAYMKTHFPVEFMAAVLSAESGNQDKLALGIEECRRMNILVLPPSLNLSSAGFSLENEKKSLDGKAIRFGLSAIKNVGEAAIEAILNARNKEGVFSSLRDFICRVDQQKINKKVLESLIKVGALDNFGKRAAMLIAISEIRSKAVSEIKKKESGQTDLFDTLETNNSSTNEAEKLPDVEELPKTELLSMEKELLGFYLTDNPLAKALKALTDKASHKINELNSEVHSGRKVKLAGIITSFRKVITKNSQKEMAFATLEDSTGKIDLVIFPKLYSQTASNWSTDKVFLVAGTVDQRDDKLSMVVEQALSETSDLEADDNLKEGLIIDIPQGTDREILQKLSSLLQANKGSSTVKIRMLSGNREKIMLLPYGVNYGGSLQTEVDKLLKTKLD